ncbi:MAG: hypothetical protein OEV00_07445 [Acidobacteriota bacterium]|nr:hypothetical protein [Acidobacteriota bacterium]MDH3785147.1 hypothetical protein [Acidobacteriota bacterium]
MRIAFKVLSVAVALAILTTPASAWTARTRIAMTQRAVELMPRTLRTALQGHEKALLRGLLDPMKDEDGADHRPMTAGGDLEAAVLAASRELRGVLDRPARFDEVAEAFGRLAHYTLDVGFPPGVSPRDDTVDSRYRHFGSLCEERLPKFPLVYYDDHDLGGGLADVGPYVEEILARATTNDAVLADAYDRAGDPPHRGAFDDRSVPFAVASISYSRSVNDIARVWLAVWQEADGDMSHTPFRNQSNRQPDDPRSSR